jgi:hypothetical protein
MYMMVSLYIGLGFSRWSQNRPGLWTIVTAVLLGAVPLMYPVISNLAESQKMDLGTRRHIPYRDEYPYYLIPWQQHQTGPRYLVTQLFEKLPSKSIVLADRTTISALHYAQQIEHGREDLQILSTETPIDELPSFLVNENIHLFTLSNVTGYFPIWARDFTPFALSDSEQIWEIHLPKEIGD